MDLFSFLLFVLAMLILSAIVSGSEAALLSVSYTKAKEILSSHKGKKKKKQAERLVHIKDNLKDYITTLVIINNIINIVGSIYVGVIAAELFGEFYLGVISGVMTFLIIIFGEIIPKIFGEKHCVNISLFVSFPLIILAKVLRPVIYVFNGISNVFIKSGDENYVSEGEIREMAALGEQEGSINAYESEVIQNVFRMNDIGVHEIMVPKIKAHIIDYHANFDDIVKIGEKTGCTRFPVMRDDEIVGLINIKDLFKFHTKEKSFKVSKILRPILFAPESMKIFSLQERLKKNRIHMALIVNEHGEFTGIVSFEDIIEELLGDIEDEYDVKEEDPSIIKINLKKFHVKGETDIDEFNHYFNLELNWDNNDYRTVNGYITYKLDKIPKVNDELKLEFGTFRIIKATKKQILMVEFNLE